MSDIANLIAKKTGYPDLLTELNKKLSGSELNTLLLELFRNRTKKITPTELLKYLEKNRFTVPSSVNTIDFKELEIRCLKLAASKNFIAITLSPLTPLGTCSALGFVDQNNIVSALRGTEVVSDATNVFALLIAHEFKKRKKNIISKYAATHRHVRGQALSNPALTPHFGVFCMATGGIDTGNFSFELEHLFEHINIHLSLLSEEFDKENLFIKIYLKDQNETFHKNLKIYLKNFDNSLRVEIEKEPNPGDYYKLVQFKIFLEHKGKQINLSDGGLVDWTQKLIPNKKHRLIISGAGTELIHKIKHGQL
jgi:hypothetical protein